MIWQVACSRGNPLFLDLPSGTKLSDVPYNGPSRTAIFWRKLLLKLSQVRKIRARAGGLPKPPYIMLFPVVISDAGYLQGSPSILALTWAGHRDSVPGSRSIRAM